MQTSVDSFQPVQTQLIISGIEQEYTSVPWTFFEQSYSLFRLLEGKRTKSVDFWILEPEIVGRIGDLGAWDSVETGDPNSWPEWRAIAWQITCSLAERVRLRWETRSALSSNYTKFTFADLIQSYFDEIVDTFSSKTFNF